MTTTKIATRLTEEGRRELAEFLVATLSDKALADFLGPWEDDVTFDGLDGKSGMIEVRGMYTATGNPATRFFSGDAVEMEDVEVDDE